LSKQKHFASSHSPKLKRKPAKAYFRLKQMNESLNIFKIYGLCSAVGKNTMQSEQYYLKYDVV